MDTFFHTLHSSSSTTSPPDRLPRTPLDMNSLKSKVFYSVMPIQPRSCVVHQYWWILFPFENQLRIHYYPILWYPLLKKLSQLTIVLEMLTIHLPLYLYTPPEYTSGCLQFWREINLTYSSTSRGRWRWRGKCMLKNYTSACCTFMSVACQCQWFVCTCRWLRK